jgi:DNA-binding response OmpR family regulator
VDVHIRRLREKLGNEYTRIVTVKGVGYRFEAGAI